jgi:hypothetical protein
MTDSGFACLQRAVNLARDRQIQNAASLVSALERENWTKEEIDEAIKAWSDHETRTDRFSRRRVAAVPD